MTPPTHLPPLCPPTEAPPSRADGSLGQALTNLYYRRVWQHSGKAWDVVLQGYVRALTPLMCTFEGPTWCSIGPPYIYEVWWKWSPHTIGTGGDWIFTGERQNW